MRPTLMLQFISFSIIGISCAYNINLNINEVGNPIWKEKVSLLMTGKPQGGYDGIQWVNGFGEEAANGAIDYQDDENNKCLTSPGYPNNYPNNANITQTLSVPAGQSMEITFQDFDIEDDNGRSGCPYDYVEFSDENGNIIGKKSCGDSLPQNFTIPTSSATVLFQSDSSVTRKGFKFCYKPGDENNKCLTSPDYPNDYPNNANITQTLSVPSGQSMDITFQDFDIEDEDDGSACPYDYVEFSDENGNIIGQKLCGDSLPQHFTIPTSSATVLFQSDSSVTRKGFKFCYKPGQTGGQWGQWESWGQCSAACGQGTQTRRRICSDSKCPGLSVDQRQCMGSRKRIRRNVTSLSSTEKERLQKALSNAIDSSRPWQNYEDLGHFHGQPDTLCSNQSPPWCCPHSSFGFTINFLPWHRLYTVQMEQVLNTSLPYWDWTETGDVPDLWEDIAGPIKKPHFSSSGGCLGDDTTHHRRGRNINLNIAQLKMLTREALEKTNFEEFSEQIENGPHNLVHDDMGCDMATINTAAYDPVFYLHHAYVDYQFAFWQELQRLRRESGEISEEVNLSSHNTLLAPFNRLENNPFQITQRNSQGRNTFDYRNNLCYEYDNLIFDGKTPEEFLEAITIRPLLNSPMQLQKVTPSSQFCKKDSSCRVFVGIVLPRFAPTSLIKFQICSSQNRCVDGGRVATFGPSLSKIREITNSGTRSNRSSSDYYMVEFEVTDTFKKEAIFDGDLTARISFVENPSVTIGLDPVMIWRYYGGVQRGTAHLSQGSRREDYGTLLDKFDNVVENIVNKLR